MKPNIKALFLTCGSWYLTHTAKAFAERDALAGLWISDKNSTGIPAPLYRRCWPFHLAMKPFYHLAPQIWIERAFYAWFPVWRAWLRRQTPPDCNVVHAIMGYATEAFDLAEQRGALKVINCQNSHPVTYYGNWQRECDLWCPGENVPIPRWMFARITRELKRADLIVVESAYGAQTMVSNGLDESKILVNPLGVDTSIFQAREAVPEKPRFISVGTICLRKGFQYLFRAFELAKKELPDAELVVVGNYKTDFRKERPRWEGTFTHFPHLGHAQVAAELRKSTAFVFPSQEEGIARAQIEALASGLPVIGTHEGGASTLVRDGVEGFIVPAQSPEKIAAAMVKLARDRELNAQMGRAAWLKGGQANSWQDYGDRLIAEYQKRLDEKETFK